MASIGSGTILISICLLLALEPPQCWTYSTDCNFHPYKGPPGEVIAELKNTLPADISHQFSTNALSIMSGIMDAVPEAGSAFNAFFGTIAGLTDPTTGDHDKLVSSVDTLLADIRQAVSDLKEYIGANIDQDDFELKTQSLHSYLMEGAKIYSLQGAEEKKTSLRNLNIRLILSQPTFLPGSPNYETFEQLLPLTRTFVDLHMATLIDLFVMTNYSEDYKEAIKSLSVMSYNWYVAAVAQIIDQHSSSFPVPTLAVNGEKYVCTGVTYQQEWKDGAGCKESITHEATDCAVLVADFHKADNALQHKRNVYIAHMTESIKTYWRVEMGDAMEKLKQVGLKAGSTESQYITLVDAVNAISTNALGYVYEDIRLYTNRLFLFVQVLYGVSMEGW